MSTCYVYLAYDKAGTLLYVGISNTWPYRWQQHQQKPWFDEVARLDLERYPTRGEAERREVHLIRTQRPRYNIQHQPPPLPDLKLPYARRYADRERAAVEMGNNMRWYQYKLRNRYSQLLYEEDGRAFRSWLLSGDRQGRLTPERG